MADLTAPRKYISIWWFALGYFAAYVPYSFFTKVATDGLLASPFEMPKDSVMVNSFEILPPTILTGALVMITFITVMRWWKYATQWKVRLGSMEISLPRPRLWTLLSGACSGLVVMTTTLAYTIDGVSIVFAMLLMRGGLLIMSPIVDKLNKRHVRWFSWCALALSFMSLVVAFYAKPAPDGARFAFNMLLMIDVVVYLVAYFGRLSFMSKLAKSDDPNNTKRFLVEEMMVATPTIFIALFVVSLFYAGQDATSFVGGVYAGFHHFWNYPALMIALVIGIGVCSQFSGIFGGLVLLDKSENAFSVPVNRCSSIMSGIIATLGLAFFFGTKLALSEFVGAIFIICAILFLTIPPLLAKRRAKRLAE
ncbi:MAG: hypothetical protein FWC40_04005 [Proteobacteria bacterium]|nr:hypothetical protein [Pseudomonadota bacterium]